MTGAVVSPSGRAYAGRHGPAILRRFGPGAARADIDAAERRAIRLPATSGQGGVSMSANSQAPMRGPTLT